jgi:hypothetical protein
MAGMCRTKTLETGDGSYLADSFRQRTKNAALMEAQVERRGVAQEQCEASMQGIAKVELPPIRIKNCGW